MSTEQRKRIAYEMAMEYVKQNQLLKINIADSDDFIDQFAEIENAFFNSLAVHRSKFNECL